MSFLKQGLDFSKQAIAVTGDGSKLYEIAKQENWLDFFPMWDWVGGRTSETAAVGLLPCCIARIRYRSIAGRNCLYGRAYPLKRDHKQSSYDAGVKLVLFDQWQGRERYGYPSLQRPP